MRYRSPACSVAGRTSARLIIGPVLFVSLLLLHPLHASSDHVTPRRLLNSRGVTSGRVVPVQQDDAIRQHKIRFDRSRWFRWPVNGPVSSWFGRRSPGGWHDGVDIQAPQGQPVRAAAAGTVLFSGWQSSYGWVVKIAHPDGFTTVYAHNLRNSVKPGDRVQPGTVIAAVGQTGHATASHLHFEVRRQDRPQNPLPLLEPREPSPLLLAHGD
jgi:hypothetical protein